MGRRRALPDGCGAELPALVWDDALTPLRTEAERIVRRVLSRAAEYAEVQWDPNIELSDDPLESSWQLAAIAPLGQLDQFRLLRSTTVGGLLRELIDLTLAAEPVLTARSDGDAFDDELVTCSTRTPRRPTKPTTIRMPHPATRARRGPERHQPRVPGSPLNGPTMPEVIQPP